MGNLSVAELISASGLGDRKVCSDVTIHLTYEVIRFMIRVHDTIFPEFFNRHDIEDKLFDTNLKDCFTAKSINITIIDHLSILSNHMSEKWML